MWEVVALGVQLRFLPPSSARQAYTVYSPAIAATGSVLVAAIKTQIAKPAFRIARNYDYPQHPVKGPEIPLSGPIAPRRWNRLVR